MDVQKLPNGRWKLRWREAGRRRARHFDRKSDAEKFWAHIQRRRQLGQAAVPEDVVLAEFIETYWRLHAVPNLSPAARSLYKRTWANHIAPRLGDHGVRELTPKRLKRFREELEHAGVGTATVVKAMTVVQSILTFAMAEEIVEFNAARAVDKPHYQREREPVIFLPRDVEAVRARCESLRDRTLISVLAYSGPRPEESLRLTWAHIGSEAIRYDGRKTRRPRWTPLLAPLAEDLTEWFVACGRPGPVVPVFRAHDGGFWDETDWRNWRRRVWRGEPERPRRDRKRHTPQRAGAAPAGTRPRDLRSSYVTIQVYAGVPLTTIAKWCGTSVAMLERHYAGVIANWDGQILPAEQQIRAARAAP